MHPTPWHVEDRAALIIPSWLKLELSSTKWWVKNGQNNPKQQLLSLQNMEHHSFLWRLRRRYSGFQLLLLEAAHLWNPHPNPSHKNGFRPVVSLAAAAMDGWFLWNLLFKLKLNLRRCQKPAASKCVLLQCPTTVPLAWKLCTRKVSTNLPVHLLGNSACWTPSFNACVCKKPLRKPAQHGGWTKGKDCVQLLIPFPFHLSLLLQYQGFFPARWWN